MLKLDGPDRQTDRQTARQLHNDHNPLLIYLFIERVINLQITKPDPRDPPPPLLFARWQNLFIHHRRRVVVIQVAGEKT